MWETIGMCGIYRMLEGEHQTMCIKEGGRRIGLQLLDEICNADELIFVKMQLESRNRTIEEAHVSAKRNHGTEPDTSYTPGPDAEYDDATGGHDSGGTDYDYFDATGSYTLSEFL